MCPMPMPVQQNAKKCPKPFHNIQTNVATKNHHLVFYNMFVDTLIWFRWTATQAGTFTVVSEPRPFGYKLSSK